MLAIAILDDVLGQNGDSIKDGACAHCIAVALVVVDTVLLVLRSLRYRFDQA